jgi:uncharacterized protein (TIGR00730 family)
MVQRPRKKDKKNVCVFCGSSLGRDPAYAKAASALGTLIGAEGWGMIFGGGDIGLMGQVAEAAHHGGARVQGIMPLFLRDLEPPLKNGVKVAFTPDLQTRKSLMLAQADAFIILPGGLGTLDEFFEVVTSAQLSVFEKPIVVLNTKNYFAPLRALMRHIVRQGFARGNTARLFRFVGTPKAAMKAIAQPAKPIHDPARRRGKVYR